MGPCPDPELPTIISSDRACQLLINAISRWEIEFEGENKHIEIIKRVAWAIPKMHIHGHKEDCQFCYHFAYLRDCGRTCGEGVETTWVEVNHMGALAKDAGYGHREDMINGGQGHWNFCKVLELGMVVVNPYLPEYLIQLTAKFLYRKAKEAAENVERTKQDLEEYSKAVDAKLVKEWDTSFPSEKGVPDKSGYVVSRYRVNSQKGKCS